MRRRFRRRPPLTLLAAGVLVMACAARWMWPYFAGEDRAAGSLSPPALSRTPLHAGPCEVVEVIAGDEFLIRQAEQADSDKPVYVTRRVKLLQVRIARPELADSARRFAEEFAGSGRATLELDKRRIDSRGRFLAYLLVDGQMLNVELVRQGFARLEQFPGDSASVLLRLRRAQEEARLAGRGIWAKTESDSVAGS